MVGGRFHLATSFSPPTVGRLYRGGKRARWSKNEPPGHIGMVDLTNLPPLGGRFEIEVIGPGAI